MSERITAPPSQPTDSGVSEHSDPAPQRVRNWDWMLLGNFVALAGFGLLMILSASSLSADAVYGNALRFVTRQAIGITGGVVGSIALLMISWNKIRKLVWPMYIATIGVLLLLWTPLGHNVNGATRWVKLGPINLQPSEFGKLGLVLVLAHYLAANRGRLKDVVGVGLPGLTFLTPLIVLIMFQKDFGTTVIMLGLAGVLYFLAGLQWRYVVLGVTGAISLLVGLVIIEPYRLKRLVSFMDPFADPEDAGYQVVQGWIALGTGGWTGAGLGSGVAQRGFLPEAHTDFISAVVGEELGAIGWLLMVALLMGLVYRGLKIAQNAPDLFGMLVASGISTMFAAQAIINLGVVGGVVPNKGLVLPFMSYGSSAVMMHTLCVGILFRIAMESTPDAVPSAPQPISPALAGGAVA